MKRIEPVRERGIGEELFHWVFALPVFIFFLVLLSAPYSAHPDPESGVIENTKRLLNRVRAAPRLPLEMSELVPKVRADDPPLGLVSSVAVAPDGLLYVLHRNLDADPVMVFDTDGTVLRSWGNGLFTIPHSIRIDPDGNVWTVDAGSSHVYKFTPQGRELLHIDVGEMPFRPNRANPFRGATDIAFASDGNLFIADGYGNARVLEYDGTGQRVQEWGAAGGGPGEFRLVHGIAIDQSDVVYVADRENGRIQRFSRDGKLLGIWDGLGKVFSLFFDGEAVWAGTQRLEHPNNTAGWVMRLDPNSGNVVGLVAVPWAHSLTVTRAGEFLTGLVPDRILWYREIPDD